LKELFNNSSGAYLKGQKTFKTNKGFVGYAVVSGSKERD